MIIIQVYNRALLPKRINFVSENRKTENGTLFSEF